MALKLQGNLSICSPYPLKPSLRLQQGRLKISYLKKKKKKAHKNVGEEKGDENYFNSLTGFSSALHNSD